VKIIREVIEEIVVGDFASGGRQWASGRALSQRERRLGAIGLS
jgi:hypothetical protein